MGVVYANKQASLDSVLGLKTDKTTCELCVCFRCGSSCINCPVKEGTSCMVDGGMYVLDCKSVTRRLG